MSCRRCPHHVRHGFAEADGNIAFYDLCGLRVKKLENAEADKPNPKKIAVDKKALIVPKPKKYGEEQFCEQIPFASDFEYMQCPAYIETFKTNVHKNNVVPTRDFQYNDTFNGSAITDMELL